MLRMSMMRTLTGIWRNREETSERSKLPELRTKYYKMNKAKMLETVQNVLKRKFSTWRITHVDQERGEITIEKRQGFGIYDIVITVYGISSIRSAIDMVVTKRGSLGDLGFAYRTILAFFATLHQEVQPED
jgi:hypothetical protein